MQFTTDSARDGGRRGGSTPRNGGSTLDFMARMRVAEYLNANKQRIMAEQPTKDEVCMAVQRDLKLTIGQHSLKSICKAIGFSWRSRVSTTTAKRAAGKNLAKTYGTMGYSGLCNTVRELCRRVGIPVPGEQDDQNGSSMPEQASTEKPTFALTGSAQPTGFPSGGFVGAASLRDPEQFDQVW